MKVAAIYNKPQIEATDVINVFGMSTKERYAPRTVERVGYIPTKERKRARSHSVIKEGA